MRLPMADVLSFAAADPLLLLFCQLQPLLRDLFLTGDSHPATLAGSGVGVGALPSNRKPAAVTHTLIGTNLYFALDVLSDFPTQVTFNLEVLIEEPPDTNDLVVGEVAYFRPAVDLEVVANLVGPGK